MKKTLVILVVFFSFVNLFGQSPVVGHWDSYDDETGEKKSVIEIYQVSDQLFGKIIEIHDKSKADALCTECQDERKGEPITGMVIMKNLLENDEEWGEGEIMDPNNGKTYDCKIWTEGDDILKVRGYVGFFYRTQTWKRKK